MDEYHARLTVPFFFLFFFHISVIDSSFCGRVVASTEWMDRPAVRSAPPEGQLDQQNGKMWTDFQACHSRAAECLKQAFTQALRSAHSHETADFKQVRCSGTCSF